MRATLAYYAELRAAKAILASEGIGLSASRVAVVDSGGQCVLTREQGSSHQVLWEALEEWNRGNAEGIVFRLLKPFGHSIADWLGNFPGSPNPVAEEWLRTWGLDIRELAERQKQPQHCQLRAERMPINHEGTVGQGARLRHEPMEIMPADGRRGDPRAGQAGPQGDARDRFPNWPSVWAVGQTSASGSTV